MEAVGFNISTCKNKLLSVSYETANQKACRADCKVQTLDYKTFEEKETDVNIALKILEDGLFGNYDLAYIFS